VGSAVVPDLPLDPPLCRSAALIPLREKSPSQCTVNLFVDADHAYSIAVDESEQVDRPRLTSTPRYPSGNDGPMRPLIERRECPGGPPTIDLGRPADGGVWGWWFCNRCNGRTGRWDQTYQRVWRNLLSSVHEPNHAHANRYRAQAQFDVGAFIRAVWAWAFALDERMRHDAPDVAKAVLSGDPVNPPRDVMVGLALTRSLRLLVSQQRHAAEITVDLTTGQSSISSTPWAVIAAPPFSIAVADLRDADLLPHANVSHLLTHRAGDRPKIELELPIIDFAIHEVRGPISFDVLSRV